MKQRNRSFNMLILTLLVLPCAHAGPKLTLNAAIDLAIRNAPEVVNARMQRTLDHYSVDLERQALLPNAHLSLNTLAQPEHKVDYDFNGTLTFKTALGTQLTADKHSVTLKQPLYQGSRLAVNLSPLRSAQDQKAIQTYTYEQQLTTTVRQVIDAYFAVLAIDLAHTLNQHAIAQSEQLVAQSALRVQAGIDPQINVSVQHLNLMSERLDQKKTRIDRIAKLTDLKTQIGFKPQHTVELAPLAWPPPKLASLQSYQAQARQHNRALKIDFLTIEIAKRARMLAEDGRRWPVDLTATQSYGHGDDHHDRNAGIQITIPFKDIAAKQALSKADVQLKQAQLDLETHRQALDLAVAQHVHTLVHLHDSFALLSETIQHARQVYQLRLEALKAGLATMQDVDDEKQALLQAQKKLTDWQISYWLAWYDLQQTCGTLLKTFHIAVDSPSQQSS